MKIEELDLEPKVIDFLKSEGYEELFEPQEQSVKAGLFDEKKNFLITIPTASGKTLIAMLAILSHLSKYKTKVVYLTPLRALTSEKFEEFKKLEKLSIKGRKLKVAFGDAPKKIKFADADIIFLTNESMDANMAFRQDWIYDIGLVVSDEIHLIGDSTRGPTLEMVLTRLKSGFIGKNPPKIIGLSATISNSDELTEWLDCELVESKFRRVPLSEAVYSRHVITNQRREETEGNLSKDRDESRHEKAHIGLGLETVDDGGQCLIFAMSRKNAAAWANEAGLSLFETLTTKEKVELKKISGKILQRWGNGEPPKSVVALAKAVKNGTAFHHAGLPQNCREIVETEFKNGRIKFLTSTPTLAAGVNLPARRVIIPSVMRYTNNGLEKISILEYKQMCGRAGRPQYDDMGESIIIAKGSPDDILEYYVDGEPKALESQILKNKSSLRMHILSFIITGSRFKGITKEKILKFFSQTFASYQEEDSSSLEKTINAELDNLKKYEMITVQNGFEATSFGHCVSQLRIDPETASKMKGNIEHYVRGQKHTFGIIYMITTLKEFYQKFELYSDKMIDKFDERMTDDEVLYKDQIKNSIIKKYKSLLILYSWIENDTSAQISHKFDAEPGDLFFLTVNAETLLTKFMEIIKFLRNIEEEHNNKQIVTEYQSLIDESDTLIRRIRHGVKDEFLELVKIKQIGRVRAQILYKNGFKSRLDLKKAKVEKLAKIDGIGLTIANNIKAELTKIRY